MFGEKFNFLEEICQVRKGEKKRRRKEERKRKRRNERRKSRLVSREEFDKTSFGSVAGIGKIDGQKKAVERIGKTKVEISRKN
jgi:hypothetical protein